ncbi:MAG: phosphoribosylanthranilate isomerase [Bacteroidales bacterium]|jgi:phosphoribosylanthranilate isomerase|nr:phosphoribosylanthranilate isomerase [Bacteroidales bacterium]MCI1785917.1 phosphoribosylanthranilate isomerase [Bacteroidales bacterium]
MKKKMLKVCGMTDGDNIRKVEEAGADLIGLIFYPGSPRYVKTKPGYLPGNAKRVGVFVDADYDAVLETAASYSLDYVQLHGHESPDYCRALIRKGLLPDMIIKAFRIGSLSDFPEAGSYEDLCGMYLFDTKSSLPGGSGKGFDWSLLDSYHGPVPFLLGGGLGIDCADKLDCLANPFLCGYDVNSRFELAPGLKNVKLLKEFIEKLSLL